VPRQHSPGGKAWLLGISKRGNAYLRDHRPDCKQVNIALVVGRSGLPLGYEVFAGIRSDVTTVKEIVEAMESKYGQTNRIWVMDRGMVSADNSGVSVARQAPLYPGHAQEHAAQVRTATAGQ
jgi:hypothetical protein